MSGKNGKGNGVAHRVFDEVVKFKTAVVTDIGTFKKTILEAINDIGQKHNAVAAQVAAQEEILKNVAGFVGSKLGETHGSTEARFASVVRSIRGQDINIIAMGEVLKELVGQLTQTDAIFQKLAANSKQFLGSNAEQEAQFASCFQLDETDVARVKEQAEEWYKDLLTSAFRVSREKVAEQERAADAAYAAEQQKAKEAAEAAAAEQAKTQALEEELKQATLDERKVTTSTTGGPGAPFPEGAEIFGG